MDRGRSAPDGATALAAAGPDVAAAVRHSALIERSRRQWANADVRDRWTLRIGAAAFLLCAGAMAAFADWGALRPLPVLLAIPALAIASTVELELGSASAVPTEPLVITMLLMTPAGLVPLVTLAALLASSAYLRLRGVRQESPAVAACSSFFVLGPALVVQLMGLGHAGPGWWVVIGIAYGAQLVSDLLISWWRNCVGLGVGFGELLEMLRWTYSADLLLAPGAVVTVLALHGSPACFAVALLPAVLIALLARDRTRYVNHLISLGVAYSDASGQARQDALTGLGNRLAWDEAITAVDNEANQPIGVLMLDVDHLKCVNDTYGHEMGDRLLIAVAEVVRNVAAGWGLGCRLGGDEFGVLIVGPSSSDVSRLAARVDARLTDHPPIGDVPVSASVGYAEAAPGFALQAVRSADRAMYAGKQLRHDTDLVRLPQASSRRTAAQSFESAVLT